MKNSISKNILQITEEISEYDEDYVNLELEVYKKENPENILIGDFRVRYSRDPKRPATYLDPPEGGDYHVLGIWVYEDLIDYDDEGNEFTVLKSGEKLPDSFVVKSDIEELLEDKFY